MMKLKLSVSKRSKCPIATTLDLLGDKWSLLIIRDIGLFDKHLNKDFQGANERIPTNILASRLKMLVDNGLIEKIIYQDKPPRYEYHLTAAGKALLPIVKSMAMWADKFIEGVSIPKQILK